MSGHPRSNHPPAFRIPATLQNDTALSAALFLLIAWHFQPLIKFPFVLDDWVGFYDFATCPHTAEWLLASCSPMGHFFRPLWFVSLFSLYKLFGLNHAAFHVVFIFFHFVNCLLIMRVLTRLGTGRQISWAATFLYAFAPGVHEMTVLWPTSTHMVGGWLFLLLSLERYLSGKIKSSALFYFISILFKEGTLLFPALFVIHHFQARRNGIKSGAAVFKIFWPFAIALAAYILLRIPGMNAFHPGSQGAYQISLWAVLKNILYYGTLSCQSIFFVKDIPLIKNNLLLCNALFALFVCAGLFVRRAKDQAAGRMFLFFTAWYALGLLPVLAFKHIRSEFWLTYSLPAAGALFMLSAESLAEKAAGKNGARFLIFAFVAANIMLAHADLLGRERDAFAGKLPQKMSMMYRAARVKVVKDGLHAKLPQLPAHSVLLFEGVDVWSFARHLGPRLWYRDDTIEAYDFDYLKIKGTDACIEDHPVDFLGFLPGRTLAPVTLDPQSAFIVSVRENRVNVRPLTDLINAEKGLVLNNLDEYGYGDTINYDCAGQAFFSGFDGWDGVFRWTVRKNAAIHVRLSRDTVPGKNYELTIVSGALGHQPVEVSVNGRAIGSLIFDDFAAQTKRLVISGEILKPGDINLIEFKIPGARAKKEDGRQLGLAFQSLQIRPLS